jgi:AcrR family transcriptional regulator
MSDSDQGSVSERLLRAAVDVFGARGYAAARVSDIVGRAGVAQGTFYLYFESKEAIFLRLIDDFFGRLLGDTLGHYPAAGLESTRDLVAQLRQMWLTILDRCRREPVLTMLVLRDSYALGSASRARADECFARVVAAISAYFQEVSARGIMGRGISDPAAWVVLGIIERAIHYAVVIDPDADADRLVDEFLRMELGGLLGSWDISGRPDESEVDGPRQDAMPVAATGNERPQPRRARRQSIAPDGHE